LAVDGLHGFWSLEDSPHLNGIGFIFIAAYRPSIGDWRIIFATISQE
jgi:hypothetical protein